MNDVEAFKYVSGSVTQLLSGFAVRSMDLLQVSLLINKQTGGKKKKKTEGKGEGERDLWTTHSENETGQDLDWRLSFMLVEEPTKLEQVNPSLVFGTRNPQVSLSSPIPFPFFFFFPPVCLLIKSETWSKSLRCTEKLLFPYLSAFIEFFGKNLAFDLDFKFRFISKKGQPKQELELRQIDTLTIISCNVSHAALSSIFKSNPKIYSQAHAYL